MMAISEIDCLFNPAVFSGICPKHYDPATLDSMPNRRSVRLTTALLKGTMLGKYEFGFGLSSVFFNADANTFSSDECRSTLLGLKGVKDVLCERQAVDPISGVGMYMITFNEYSIVPYENNLWKHNGNPPLSSFFCNTTFVDPEDADLPTCDIVDIETEDLPGIHRDLF